MSFANLDELHCTILSTGNKCRFSFKVAAKLPLFDPVDFRKSAMLL
jgi:hypothetical protein